MEKYRSTSLKEITAPYWREMVLNQSLGSSMAHWQNHVSVSEKVNICSLTVNGEEDANNIPSYDRPQGTLPVEQHLICSAARAGKSSWTWLVSLFPLSQSSFLTFTCSFSSFPFYALGFFPSFPVRVAVVLWLCHCAAVRVPQRWLLPTALAVWKANLGVDDLCSILFCLNSIPKGKW